MIILLKVDHYLVDKDVAITFGGLAQRYWSLQMGGFSLVFVDS